LNNHTGNEKVPDLNEGSSEESWAMSESLTQPYLVGDEGENCKTIMPRMIMTLFGE